MNQKTHPIRDGWTHMNATLVSDRHLSHEEMKNIASFGHPEKYEIGFMYQIGKKFKSCSRPIKAA